VAERKRTQISLSFSGRNFPCVNKTGVPLQRQLSMNSWKRDERLGLGIRRDILLLRVPGGLLPVRFAGGVLAAHGEVVTAMGRIGRIDLNLLTSRRGYLSHPAPPAAPSPSGQELEEVVLHHVASAPLWS